MPKSGGGRLARALGRTSVAGALLLAVATTATAQQWVAAWGSSMQSASPETWTVTDASVRLVARSTIGGTQVRVRLENALGDEPLIIGAASVGLQSRGAALVPGSDRALRFDGSGTVTIPAGDLVVSDPVEPAPYPSTSSRFVWWSYR